MRQWVLRLILLALVAGGFACVEGVQGDDFHCPTPVLASGDLAPLATSCAESISFRGRTFGVGCAEVHVSRLGKVFADDGGKTRFAGARELAGFDPDRLFLLVGGGGCGAQESIAMRGNLPDSEYDLLRQPRGVHFTISRHRVQPQERVTVRLQASSIYIFGVESRLGRLVGRGELAERHWTPVRWVVSSLNHDHLTTIPLDGEVAFPAIGFRGEATWRWRVPQLRPGWYEIRKPLFADEPLDAPIEDRTVVATVRFKVSK